VTPDPRIEEQRLLVSKARAAELLSISIDTFERQVMPEVRIVKIGRRVLFSVPDLARWVDEHAAVPLVAELPHQVRRGRTTAARHPGGRSTYDSPTREGR
jgi:hypothetical protein